MLDKAKIIMKIIPYQDKYRDDLIFIILEAKNALGRVPGLNEDLLDIQKNYNKRTGVANENGAGNAYQLSLIHILEEKLMMKNIPYKIIGGQNFYQRKEIKDIIAYLRIISNPTEDIAVERIINVPKRGIGATTVERVKDYARAYGMDLYDAFLEVENIPGLSRAVSKIKGFTNLIEGYKTEESENDILKLVNAILTDTGYMGDLVAENTDEANGRIENIEELINKIIEYEENTDEPVL